MHFTGTCSEVPINRLELSTKHEPALDKEKVESLRVYIRRDIVLGNGALIEKKMVAVVHGGRTVLVTYLLVYLEMDRVSLK